MPELISRSEGRRLFGCDAAGYDAARPDYPPWIFEELVASKSLFNGAATVEIGPGSGLATKHLIAHGVHPLTLIEPDDRFAEMLRKTTGRLHSCRILHQSFEDATLADDEFDLAVAATSFHWIDPAVGLHKLRRVLKKGGTAALVWNVLQDLDKEDPFHDATKELLASLAVSPSGVPGSLPHALDRQARETDARRAGFDEVRYSESRWSFSLTAHEVGKLYEGFSHIQRLDEAARSKLLDQLMQIADERFGGIVERNVTSCSYRLS